VTSCPGVTCIGVKTAHEWEEFVIAVRAGAVTDEGVYDFSIFVWFYPFWIVLGDGCSCFDEVAVVEVVVV